MDLHREAGHLETGRRQRLQVMQLLDVAVTDLAARAMTFPDHRRITILGVLLGRETERSIPAPRVRTGQPNAHLEKVNRGVVTDAAPTRDVVVLTVVSAS